MTNKATYLLAALLALGGTAANAEAPSTTSHDAQCLLISGVLASKQDPKIRTAGMMGSMFFLGKLLAVDPNLDLTATLKKEYDVMTPPAIIALQPKCNAELEARSRQLGTAGDTLVPPKPIK